MDKFKIYCTEEQIRKALKLGAPVKLFLISESGYVPEETKNEYNLCGLGNNFYIIPTAGEMIGWIEEQENIKEVSIYCDVTGLNWSFEGYKDNGSYAFAGRDSYPTRKEATIAAIDAALEYLSKNKN